MQWFALLAVQMIAVVLLVGNSQQSPAAKIVRHTIKQVLGISYLAQDTTDQTQPTDQQQTPPQETQPQQQAQPQETQAPQQQTPQTTEQPAPETATTAPQQPESPSPTEMQTSPQPTEAQVTETPLPEGQLNSQETANALRTNPSLPLVEDAAITADNAIASTENISGDAATQAERNDTSIDSATNPNQKSADILASEQEDLNLLNTTTKNNNYATSSFLTQRFITNLQNLTATLPTASNIAPLQTQLTTLCNQADTQLRTQQLIVPEEMEQDMEIARSLCR